MLVCGLALKIVACIASVSYAADVLRSEYHTLVFLATAVLSLACRVNNSVEMLICLKKWLKTRARWILLAGITKYVVSYVPILKLFLKAKKMFDLVIQNDVIM